MNPPLSSLIMGVLNFFLQTNRSLSVSTYIIALNIKKFAKPH